MKGFGVLPVILLFLFFSMSFSEEVTVTLQNGLNNYDGCEDSWVFGAYYNNNDERSKNYGNETKLSVFYGNNGSEFTRGNT
jgi:hypothetical protein